MASYIVFRCLRSREQCPTCRGRPYVDVNPPCDPCAALWRAGEEEALQAAARGHSNTAQNGRASEPVRQFLAERWPKGVPAGLDGGEFYRAMAEVFSESAGKGNLPAKLRSCESCPVLSSRGDGDDIGRPMAMRLSLWMD